MSGAIEDAPDQLLGRVINGKLRIDALIGSGAMGHVFRARHLHLDKDVAIKVLRALDGAQDVHSRRFAREARAASRLEHPHGVRVLDFGEDGQDRLLYLVMELIEGEDVQTLIDAQGALDLRTALGLMEQALSAVAAAHDQGVIHRDLKPSNLLVSQRPDDAGRVMDWVKVCDFGLAKFVSGARESLDGSRGNAKRVVGTPAYMSPEQAVGDALDVRTDLYSCGVILFEMLTGRLPFEGDTAMGVMIKHVSEAPPPPRQFNPHLPEAIDQIVLWALQKERELRCQSARDLRQALLQLRRGLSGELVAISLTSGTRSSADWAPAEPLPESALLPSGITDDLQVPARSASTPPNPADLVADLGIGPAPAPASSVRPQPEPDLDMEALVNEAVRSVRDERGGSSNQVPEHSLLAGFDPRRVGAEVSDRAMYMWTHYGLTFEPFGGPHPFWVRDHRGQELGPLGIEDATRILRIEGAQGHGHLVDVGDAQRQWMSAPSFVKLSGQEDLLDREMHPIEPVTNRTLSGSLDRTSLPALFTRVCLEQITGRLIFQLSVNQDAVTFELHLVGGSPTFVYANEPSLQLPQLLVSQGLVQAHLLPSLLQTVIGEERPLEDVVARFASMDLTPYRAVFMRERLRFLFRHPLGTYTVRTDTLPARTAPFAPSLLAVLPDLVYTSIPEAALEAAVARYLHVPLKRSENLQALARRLRLSSGQLEIARQLLRSPSIAEALPEGAYNLRPYYAMAYLMLECGLLLAPL